MDLYAVIDHVVTLLRKHGRVSYRAIQLQFALTDEQLEAVTDELIAVRELAVDKDGKMLVWQGDDAVGSAWADEKGLKLPSVLGRIFVPSQSEDQRLFSVAHAGSRPAFSYTTQAHI